ncbi:MULTISPECIES: HAD family phosphatase [unclassified Bradyrhizobium]|uniref:HAD family hydrolase n=1 Tax=unclassified Bradyrhizobium TaxID=2631580 RepID=UPI00247A13EE|nr:MULTISPECIES: HAD family phosphatase [unclassified Bradyrhizobium]WGR74243.1 HAD family phosphatase [Bradyrhizobium sp. ISRA426]WGR79078.1 HAD family phosphatase [Bradyrhizobium sp. ISRA430]WGR89482.1 HAD family phosphatase [Bradyrhizobium sp. ISRA432]
MTRAIIFDFDGVIADSEVLSNTVLAEIVTELGVPTTLEDAYRDYMGKRFHEVIAAIETAVGRTLPPSFGEHYQGRTLTRFRQELAPVAGVREFITRFTGLSRCIASSSSPDRLAVCLEVLDMASLFEGRVFSASNVARGKPHPDIFLHAAAGIDVPPRDCIVIEDSASGVIAGRAAGATVIGLLAAGHIRQGHAATLRDAGAHYIAADYVEVERIVGCLLASQN